MDTTDDALTRIDTSVAQPARRYNYWLGGKDYFAADRTSGDAIAYAMPGVKLMAVENRAFLGRAVRYLAERGIRQFLDVGTGIPAPNNTHEVAQSVHPATRVVYVDNDPIVLAHARSLLATAPGGINAYIDADIRAPHTVLEHPNLRATLDLSQPVALLLVAVLHFVREDEDPQHIIDTLTGALAPGSYVVASHATWEYLPAEAIAALSANNPDGRFQPRTGARFMELMSRFTPEPPGIVSVAHWHAADEPGPRPSAQEVACHAMVSRIG